MTVLPGRATECQVLDDLLTTIRSGHSAVKVLLGEAGIGKTALLEALRETAADFLIVGATGVESDMELAFAGLHQICAPILSLRHSLPAPQRQALDGAFGLASTTGAPDRFLVGLAVVGLLAAASADRPVLVVADDVQWLDSVSAQTLFFIARRLLAEPVGVVLALRTPVDGISGLPAMVVGGLDDQSARALLESMSPGPIDVAVRDRIITEARGNPLALRAMTIGASEVDAPGGQRKLEDRPLVRDIEARYESLLGSLPAQTRNVLLLAAAEPVGDPALLRDAMMRLGLDADVLGPAEQAGLITVDTRVQFFHPLARSVAYRSGTVDERRAAHRALAEVTNAGTDPDRRAWHLASAALTVDPTVADELESSAVRARQRGGTAAAAAFLTRSVELTPDRGTRGVRALAAAEAHREIASFDAAQRLLAIAELSPLTDLQRARLAQLRTRLSFVAARANGDAQALVASVGEFATVAKQLESLDAAAATEAYLEAMSSAMYVGRNAPPRAAAIATAARRFFLGVHPTRPLDEVAFALADRLALGPAAAMPAMRKALAAVRRAGRQEEDGHNGQWFWLAFPVVHESLIHEVWDDGAWHDISATAVRLAAERGTLAVLPVALLSRAGAHVETGEFDSARAYVAEANEISVATGYSPLKYHKLMVAAWSGEEAEARRLIASALADCRTRGEGRIAGLAYYCASVLHNGTGNYESALAAAHDAFAYDDLGFNNELLTEFVEAAARAGKPGVATDAMKALETRTLASGSPRALGALARCRALLAEGDEAEQLYREALDHYGRTRQSVSLARTHLVYGEWLRRHDTPTAARVQLRTAHDSLRQMGAQAFAERARRELRAAGVKTRRQGSGAGESLTPRELQIAQMAGSGLTNQEIASQLFVSAHTVEYHLRKVFAKLNIRSRRELRTAFG